LRWSDWARLRDPAAKQTYLWDALQGTLRGDGTDATAWRQRAGSELAAGAGAERAAAPGAAARWWRTFLDGGGSGA
jgi:hypothetical protein